ncbi:MAG: C40 family peptidase [Gemmatimonadetes bacterium]|nr:C40 family peptidase [Gemmatimonadota bacterium]
MTSLEDLVEDIRRKWAPEPRTSIFEVRPDVRAGAVAFVGITTEPEGAAELLARAARRVDGRAILDEIVRLPDPTFGDECWAVVRSGVAPVHAAPDIRSTQVTQYVLGSRLQLLVASGRWVRVRGDDGYLGWVNRGYLATGRAAWVDAWWGDDGLEPVVSLGAVLLDDGGAPTARLPWGARVARDALGRVHLPDGSVGTPVGGELVPAARLAQRFPPTGESIVATAHAWIGAPYVWGGTTMGGVDCSGLVQAVYRMHGITLPRDAELQYRVGTAIEPGDGFSGLRPGDLLFFTEVPGRITHVALSAGGSRIVHSALANGGVGTNDLCGDRDLEPRLREMFVTARRVLD